MNGLYDEIRVAVHSVWTRRWLVLAVAWGICILGWLAVASIPNRYDSRARLLVDVSDDTYTRATLEGRPAEEVNELMNARLERLVGVLVESRG